MHITDNVSCVSMEATLMKSRVSACKHDSGLARIHSQRINPSASMPAAKPIASAAGLIQAIKGAREPLLVAYTLMDNASMQRYMGIRGEGGGSKGAGYCTTQNA